MGHSAEKLSVKQRRILIMQWVGEAYEKLRGPEYQKLRYSCFQKTGCLIIELYNNNQWQIPESEVPPSDDLKDEEDNNITYTNDDGIYSDYKSDHNLNHSLVCRWFYETITWRNSKTQ